MEEEDSIRPSSNRKKKKKLKIVFKRTHRFVLEKEQVAAISNPGGESVSAGRRMLFLSKSRLRIRKAPSRLGPMGKRAGLLKKQLSKGRERICLWEGACTTREEFL